MRLVRLVIVPLGLRSVSNQLLLPFEFVSFVHLSIIHEWGTVMNGCWQKQQKKATFQIFERCAAQSTTRIVKNGMSIRKMEAMADLA